MNLLVIYVYLTYYLSNVGLYIFIILINFINFLYVELFFIIFFLILFTGLFLKLTLDYGVDITSFFVYSTVFNAGLILCVLLASAQLLI